MAGQLLLMMIMAERVGPPTDAPKSLIYKKKE
jgi:hypothetical protein